MKSIIKELNKGIDDVSKRQEICLDSHRYKNLESLKEGLYFSLGAIQPKNEQFEAVVDYWENNRLSLYDLKEFVEDENLSYLYQTAYDYVCLFLTHLKELRDE